MPRRLSLPCCVPFLARVAASGVLVALAGCSDGGAQLGPSFELGSETGGADATSDESSWGDEGGKNEEGELVPDDPSPAIVVEGLGERAGSVPVTVRTQRVHLDPAAEPGLDELERITRLPAPAPSPGSPPMLLGAEIVDLDPVQHTLTLRRDDVLQDIEYGLAPDGTMFIDDMGVGNQARIVARLGGARASISDTSKRWPLGVIPFAYDYDSFDCANVSPAEILTRKADLKTMMEATIADYSTATPIRFVEVPLNQAVDKVVLQQWRGEFGSGNGECQTLSGGSSQSLGKLGGDQYIWLKSINVGTLRHEIGHVLGMVHVHQREDRDRYVAYEPLCVAEVNKPNFDPTIAGVDRMFEYDPLSMMHYSSLSFCEAAPWPGGLGCGCFPLWRIDDEFNCPLTEWPSQAVTFAARESWISQMDAGCFIIPKNGFTDHDRTAILAMYPPDFATPQSGDRFGASAASGDFDGDGLSDVAVGAGSSVLIYRGVRDTPGILEGSAATNSLRFIPWREIPNVNPTALETGRFFGDDGGNGSADDLVVTSAAADAGGHAGSGEIRLYNGIPDLGLEQYPVRLDLSDIFPADAGSNTRFGSSVAVIEGGHIGSSPDSILVGAIGVNNWAGKVYRVYEDGSGSTGTFSAQAFEQVGVSEPGDYFGWSITEGDFNVDGLVEFAVGAPGDGEGGVRGGSVSVFLVDAAGLFTNHSRLDQTGLGLIEPEDLFGWSLASGDFDGNGLDDLIVGNPAEDFGTKASVGIAYRFETLVATGGGVVMQPREQIRQFSSDAAAQDAFGSSIAVGKVAGHVGDEQAYAMITAPGEAYPNSATDGAGQAWIYRFETGTGDRLNLYRTNQSFQGGTLEAGDRYGEFATVLNLAGDGHESKPVFFTGAPGEDLIYAGADAGTGFIYEMTTSPTTRRKWWFNRGKSSPYAAAAVVQQP